jgi:hypothetical protein
VVKATQELTDMDELDFDFYYPAWLGNALLRHTLSWNEGLSVLMHVFLMRYTLHDSVWEALWGEPGSGEATAVIRWDSYWSEGKIPFPENEYAQAGQWPLLLIRFQRVYRIVSTQISFDEPADFPGVIMRADSRQIQAAEREHLLTAGLRQPSSTDNSLIHLLDDQLCLTRFVGVDDERNTEILHGGPVRLLCFNPSGDAIAIPGF